MIVSVKEPDFDVGIVGAGPAGSSMAAYLARAGVKCVVLEKELFPRPHVGFISNPKYRIDVIKLLQGDVYDEEEPSVLTEMRRIVSSVEKNPRHVWHDLLGDLTANVFVDLAQRAD